ncbi:winged helix DNA-binding domain-containing protein [Solihabitans fulvus]|uniref:Winged helix DNA-binding domain-containing protein n=1 Tax=Solihabitans fulvus TaxID=1892852 RepID=A0A5B2XF00_9PSEU|nr:winged helix DNA-binding domain-containing protein [Solihabitans fulvus]KAA2261635.1 winged helix DNA-binding domain-containing protein [Solihabitans fulvus]
MRCPEGATITARELNRATLGRQLLLGREPLGAPDALRRVVAVQAQHAASPYLALWNRLADFDPADLDAAFAERKLVKATLMRFTLHVVHPDDHPAMHSAMQPTLRSRMGDPRFARSGLSAAEADALVPDLLAFLAKPRVTAEVEEWFAARIELPPKGAWWALRTFAPVLHAPTGDTWSFGQRPAYVAAGAQATPYDRERSDDALTTLVLRYLAGFGPASAADVAQFALVQRARARTAVAALGDSLERLTGPDGTELFDVPSGLRPLADTPAPPRLMAMWDSVLLAHADRGRVIPPDYRPLVTRSNGDVLPTLLVDGQVAGVWRPVDGGIEATAFHRLPAEVWAGLAAEAEALTALLADREPTVYRRFRHWWAALPSAEVRVLPG